MDVMPREARFLSPSLGNPSFLSLQETRLAAFIVAKKGSLDLPDFKDAFYLSPVRQKGPPISLHTEQVTQRSNIPFTRHLRKILGPKKEYSFFEVELERKKQQKAPGPKNQRFNLYNLCHPQIDTALHAVVLLNHNWENIRFCFISDLHVAEVWDSIEADFSKLPDNPAEIDPEYIFELSRIFSRRVYRENYVNPNRNLVHFIQTANALAEKNELDFIIAGGDLVDSKFKHERSKRAFSYTDTNYSLLEDILSGKYDSEVELEVPLFTVTGNHDYRLYPSSIRNYGLERCGIHDLLKHHYLSKCQNITGRRFSIKDLGSIRDKKGKHHSLSPYFVRFNPHTDFSFLINKTLFVFLDSGRDAFLNLAHTHILRYINLTKAILASWYSPDSEGLSEGQIDFIRKEMNAKSAKNVVLIVHAGLINTPFNALPVKEYSPDTMPISPEIDSTHEFSLPIELNNYLRTPDSIRTNVAFESRLKKVSLNFGGLFKNQLRLLALACDPGSNFLGLSGHNHRNLEIKVDKTKGTLHSGDYTFPSLTDPFNEEASYFLSSNALSQVQPRYKTPQIPGYYEAHIQDDHFVDIRRKRLDAPPFDSFLFFARLIERSRSEATIEVLSEVSLSQGKSASDNMRLIVTFLIGLKKGRRKGGSLPLEIIPRNRGSVINERLQQLTPQETMPFAGKRNICLAHSFLCKGHSSLLFNFRQIDDISRTYEVFVLCEYVLSSQERLQTLKHCWHPVVFNLKL